MSGSPAAVYFRWVFLSMAVASAFWLGLLAVNRELFTTSAGLDYQERSGGIYGRAFVADDHHYKLLLYRMKKPKLMALGSSRTMQFRDSFFLPSQHFMTAGGAMQSLAEGRVFMDEALASGAPEMVILGLDYWWFNPNSGILDVYRSDDAKYESYTYVVAASVGFLPRLLVNSFRLRPLPAPFTRDGAVGARAHEFADGFRLDGSYNAGGYYAGTIRDARTTDPDYSFTLGRVRSENHPFEGGDEVSGEAVAQYEALLDMLKARGVSVSVFMPPFAPEVADALASTGRHGVLERVRSIVKQITVARGIPFHDFTTVPFSDRRCYEDGFHANQYVYARMTQDIVPAERTDGSALAALLSNPARVCEAY